MWQWKYIFESNVLFCELLSKGYIDSIVIKSQGEIIGKEGMTG